MGTLCRGLYKGDLLIETSHELSNVSLLTDAPVDNLGKGLSFSPTDLVGVALGACILTTMGIVAQRENLNINGSCYSVEKIMTTELPRRIASLNLVFDLPSYLSEGMRKKLENTAQACPVHRSLHADVKIIFTFNYDLKI
jgi:putative redox protein